MITQRITTVLFLLVFCIPLRGMEGNRKELVFLFEQDQVPKLVKAAFSYFDKGLSTEGQVCRKHLLIAEKFAKLVYPKVSGDMQKKLFPLLALPRALQAIDVDDCDKALLHIVDVIQGDFEPTYARRAYNQTMGLVFYLADEKFHWPSQYYLIKQLINSDLPKSISSGLQRYEAACEQESPNKKNEEDAAVCLKCSSIVEDIKRLADKQENAHAQCIMAESHLFQAQRGRDMYGKEVDSKKELQAALTYAKLAQGKHEGAQSLVELITQESDAGYLYREGRALVGVDDQKLQQNSLQLLQCSARLGNPFAAQLVGDIVQKDDMELAAAYYLQAQRQFTTAPRGSLYREAWPWACEALNKKFEQLEQASGKKSEPSVLDYQLARMVSRLLLQKKQRGDPLSTKKIELLYSLVQDLEQYFVQHKHEVNSVCLKALATSGVLDLLDQCKLIKKIPSALIGAFTLRGQLGRGFILKEKTKLAHYTKALQFIVDPKQALKQSLYDFVEPTSIGLKKIEVSDLSEEGCILYLECMFGIVEELSAVGQLDKKKARALCRMFCLATEALEQSGNENLDVLFAPKVYGFFDSMHEIALAAKSEFDVGKCYMNACKLRLSDEKRFEYVSVADQLFSKLYKEGKHETREGVSAVKKPLARTKALHIALYREFLKYNPDDKKTLWQLAQLLIKNSQKEVRGEGLGIITQLADHNHRQARVYLANGYFDGVVDLFKPDHAKAIRYFRLLVDDPATDASPYRIMLAKAYTIMAIKKNGLYQKKLFTKAEAVLKSIKTTNDDAHITLIRCLRLQGRDREISQELKQYQWHSEQDEATIKKLAEAYLEEAEKYTGELKKAFKQKAVAVLESIKDPSIPVSLLLFDALLEQRNFTKLAVVLGKKSSEDKAVSVIKQIFTMRMMLAECGVACMNLLTELMEKVLTDFKQLNGEIEQYGGYLQRVTLDMFAIVTSGACTEYERKRMLAYGGYYGACIALAYKTELKKGLVARLLASSIEAALVIKDKECCEKIFKLLSSQSLLWLTQQKTASNTLYAVEAIQAVALAKKLCPLIGKNTEFAAILNYAQTVLNDLDVSNLTKKDQLLIAIQKKLIERLQQDKVLK